MLDRDTPNTPDVDSVQPGSRRPANQQPSTANFHLPDIAEFDSDSGWETEPIATGKKSLLIRTFNVGVVILLAAAALGGLAVARSGLAETGHANWTHVSAATAASDTVVNRLVHVDGAGADQVVSGIEVSYRDADRVSMRQIRTALLRQDIQSANQLLKATQQGTAPHPSSQPPDLATNAELLAAFQERGNELFEIFLFDCCAEDGDIVEVLVNDVPFSTIPITHQGSTVSIPLHQGVNSLTIRGVADGGGGITVGFRTNRGDFYSGSMSEGQDHRLGVIVK